jgi:molecular chaperone GrpE
MTDNPPKKNRAEEEEKDSEIMIETEKDTREEKKEEKEKEQDQEQKEKLLRLAAEFDNYKKRVQKELEESNSMGKASLAKEILPIIDEFELAMIALDKSEDKTMVKGIEMLYSNLIDVLKRNGLREIKCEGMFDPYKHEIMMVKESKEKEGTILEVIKKGYEFSGKLLRPSSVIVAKASPKEKETK